MKICSIIASALLILAVPAAAETVSEIAALYREQAARESQCTLTGAVSCVVAWQTRSFIMVETDNPNGPAIYVGGDLENLAELEGADSVETGDIVEVCGKVTPFMLEPGVIAHRIRIVGHREFPAPPERRVADLTSGCYNNRRVSVKGILRRVRIRNGKNENVTELTIGTQDGPILANLRGEWPRLGGFRDAEVLVDGVCVPSYNARAEFLRPQIEIISADSIHLVPFSTPAPLAARTSGRGLRVGVLAWTPDGFDGHLRRLRGAVTFVSERERYFVVLANTAVRVELDEGRLPAVGDEVEADGFPVISGDSGVLANASYRFIGHPDKAVAPEEVALSDLVGILDYGDPGEFDCHYRLVRLEGRIASASVMPDGTTVIDFTFGNHLLSAVLEEPCPELVARLTDRPLAKIAGVIKVSYEDKTQSGRGMAIREFTLLMRSPADVVLLPDMAARARRMARIARQAGLWSLLPIAALAVWLTLRAIRLRERAAAVAVDRKRMAEELHDTIAQYISGARLLLFSVQAESSALSSASREAIAMAGDILETARRDLRDKILNLQNDELMLLSIDRLIRRIAARADAASGARVRTRLRGLPAEMSVELKNDLLAIVQEAITNAVKHGHARRIIITADPIIPDGFSLGVLNDGEAFSPERSLGPETGHFGLSSMRERASRNALALRFGRRGKWTEVRIERRKR